MSKSPHQEENPNVTGGASASNAGATAGSSSSATSDSVSPELAQDVARETEARQWKEQLTEANERALRAQAELENFRKRSRREMEDERRYAATDLIRDILNVGDNLQRAIASAENATGNAALVEGVKMVAIQLHTYLENHHCRPIETLGTAFDPNRHEAIAQEPSSEHAAGTVVREVRSGYLLHDRVVRPAQVIVSSGPPATNS